MKRLGVAVLLVLATAIVATEDGDDDIAEEIPKPAYVAPLFSEPYVSGSPLLVDWFSDRAALGTKWIKSVGKKDDVEDSIAKYNGEWEIGAPTKNVIDGDMGLIVKTKARHHAIAAKLDHPFTFSGTPLVVQYEVKYEDGQECGGGYVKLLTEGSEKNLEQFTDRTPYTIMFGPDKCGQTSKVHFIVRFKNPKSGVVTEHHAKQPSKSVSSYFDDHRTHLYTLVIRPDESFTVLVDNTKIMSGSLINDLEPSITPTSMIDDPDDKKPEDWDEREKIDDPDAKKPDDWDEDAPKEIVDPTAVKPEDWLEDEETLVPDPEAKMPEDWDAEMDGEWEAPRVDNPKCKGISGCGKWTAPKIPNPAYKGKWKAARIANPAYKGKWTPRQIENPNFFEPHPYSQMMPITTLGIELWTMSANIIIDNMFVGESEKEAADFARQTFSIKNSQEEAFESASSPKEGIVQKLLGATEERPWLWAVYVLAVLVPVILIAIACFGRRSRPSAADYKKTDEPQPDDDVVPDLVGDDDEQPSEGRGGDDEGAKPAAEEKPKKRTPSSSPSRVKHRTPSSSPSRSATLKTAKNKADLEQEEELELEHSSADDDDEEIEDVKSAERSSPKGGRRPRQRRED